VPYLCNRRELPAHRRSLAKRDGCTGSHCWARSFGYRACALGQEAISLEQSRGPSVSQRHGSEDDDLAHSGDICEAVKPGIDVIKLNRATFKPVDG
jgi:hypothetical protein